jgi:hypothetical protein
MLSDARLIGYTGKSFRRGCILQTDETYQLHWTGIDVDDISNGQEQKGADKIHAVLPHVSIRLSTGGHGLHLITRIEPIEWQGNASRIVENFQRDWVVTLESELKIKVCKYDSRPFFLFGSENKWLYESDEIKKIDKLDLSPNAERHQAMKETVSWEYIAPSIKRLLTFLNKKGVRAKLAGGIPSIQGVYIKEIYGALKDSKYKFVTSSRMASTEWHCNGWMIVGPCLIKIQGFADNKPCLELFDDAWI